MAAGFVTVSGAEGSFDCYLASPPTAGTAPALVMASSVFGVTEDLREICDTFAGHGYLVAAPDLFWRGDKGPLPRNAEGEKRAMGRVADRSTVFAGAVRDMDATLRYLRSHPACNGKSAILGFCFGGPFAVVGVKQLGCDAGASYHGSAFDDQLGALATTEKPLELHWGDADFALPPELLEGVRTASASNKNCGIVIYPGVRHGYTTPTSPAFDPAARDNSWSRTLRMLDALKPARSDRR